MISLERTDIFSFFGNSYEALTQELPIPLPREIFTICLSFLEKDLNNVKLSCRSFYVLAQNPHLPFYSWILTSQTIRQKELAKEKPLITYGMNGASVSPEYHVAVMRAYACNHLRKAEGYCIVEEKKALPKVEKRSFLKINLSFLKKKSKGEAQPIKIRQEQPLLVKEAFVEHLLLALDQGYSRARDFEEKAGVCEEVEKICVEGFVVHSGWIEENGEHYLSIFNQSLSMLLKQLNLTREDLLSTIRTKNLSKQF